MFTKKVELSNELVIVNVPMPKITTTCLNQRTTFHDLVFAHFSVVFIVVTLLLSHISSHVIHLFLIDVNALLVHTFCTFFYFGPYILFLPFLVSKPINA